MSIEFVLLGENDDTRTKADVDHFFCLVLKLWDSFWTQSGKELPKYRERLKYRRKTREEMNQKREVKKMGI